MFDAGTDGGQLYLVMQYVSGAGLGDLVAEKGTLPLAWAAAVSAQIAAVLAAAHAVSLVHRDLKPANVMVADDGTVKVLDFGIAALLEPDVTRLTATNETLGSPAYMAPEQVLHGTVTPRTDLYSLGCLMHEMISSEPLFSGGTSFALMQRNVIEPAQPLRKLRSEVPEAVERLVLDLLAKDPEQRPVSAEDVYRRLLPFLPVMDALATPADRAEATDPTRPYRFPLAPRRGTGRPSASDVVADRPPREAPAAVDASGDVAAAQRSAADLVESGRFTQAAEVLSRALAAAEAEPAVAGSVRDLRLSLANALLLGEDYRRALPEYQRVAVEAARDLGPEDELILWCRYQVATSRAALGDFAEALAEFESLLAVRRARLGPDHGDVLELCRQIGVLRASSGDVSGARTLLADLLADAERIHGRDHPETADVRQLLTHLERLDDRGTPGQ